MNRIISKRNLPKELIRLEISTPVALLPIEPGQYIVVKTQVEAAGMALPVVKTDAEKSILTVIACPGEKDRGGLSLLDAGSVFHSLEGPYGVPLQVSGEETVLCAGDEKGIVALLPVMSLLRKSGCRVMALVSAPTSQKVVLQEEIGAVAHQVMILTADGSLGQQATLEPGLSRILKDHQAGQVIVAGSARTIRDAFCATILHPVSVKALLLATTGDKNVHNIFRVSICANVRSVRVEGHNFSAYYATFDEMVRRFEPVTEAGTAMP